MRLPHLTLLFFFLKKKKSSRTIFPATFLASWNTCVFACFTCFTHLAYWRALCACVFGCLKCSHARMRSRALRTWRSDVVDVLQKLACLACFLKWRAWRASKNYLFGVLHKMACLKLLDSTCELQILNAKWCSQWTAGNC